MSFVIDERMSRRADFAAALSTLTQVIFAIQLQDLDVTIEEPGQAYNALVRNNAT